MYLKSTFKQWLLAGVIFGTSLAANAVGLGKLTVVSALGQPLKAEIELVAVQKEELASLNIRMAAPSAFQQANIDYAGSLNKIRFAVENRNGRPYIQVSSTQAISEPFIDMLVEVNWASGRLLREYTFLLDPPGFGSGQAVDPLPAIQSKPLVPEIQAAPSVTPPPTPSVASQGSVSDQANTGRPETAARKNAAAKPRDTAGAAGDAYTTRRGDTLSKVADSVKPEGVSLEQMLIALYRSNPGAFEGKNINRLKAGQTLTVPDRDQVMSISTVNAAKEVRVQSTDWRAYRQKLAGMASDSGADKSQAPQQSATGKVTATVDDKATASKEPAKDQLRLSKNEPISAKDGAVGADRKTQDRINALQEEAIAKDKAIKEANSRVADLEKTVKDMQRLLEIKNQNLADVQKQAQGKPGDAKPAVGTKPDVAVTVTAPAASVVPAPTASKPADVPVAAAPATPVTPATAPVPVAAAPVPATAEVPKPVTPKPVVKQVKTITPPPPPERTFVEELTENPGYIGIALIVALGLLALAIIAMRRKKNNTGFEDSIITGGDLKANTVFGNTGGGVVNTGDNSFITDFSREGLAAADTDEVDPIAEAEVYMAYGRDSQAEEILKDALQKDPNRFEIYTKLLEIYAGRKNVTAFETLASELYAATGGQGEDWAKAAEMGRGIDAQNPLYSGTVATSHNEAALAAAAMGAAAAGAEIVSENAHHHEVRHALESAEPEAIAEHQPAASPDLDFDLDPPKPAEPTAGAPAPSFDEHPHAELPAAHDHVDNTLDFDLGSFDEGQPSHAVETHEPPAFNMDDGLMFDLGDDAEAHAPAPTSEATHAHVETHHSFDFDTAVTTSTPAMSEIDLSGIDLNLENSDSPHEMHFESDAPNPDAHWQEVATKLDLARAYHEMGDHAGAREILQEVLHEGDDQQKVDASAILAKLD